LEAHGGDRSRSELILYVEGGGYTRKLQDGLRRGFSEFLKNLARKPRIAVSGGRGQAVRDFRLGVRDNPNAIHVLLIDSEGPLAASHKEHVVREFGEELIGDLSDERFHLMVQMMEAWLIADPVAIQRGYPRDASIEALSKIEDVESISKDRLMQMIARATGGKYEESTKREHGARLLGHARADEVSRKSKSCARFLDCLNRLGSRQSH
jgi:hypothetical protein